MRHETSSSDRIVAVDSPKADSLDAFNGHYFQLLLSELLYKNDCAQTNRNDLLKAVDYFDGIGDAFLDARAHYINGVENCWTVPIITMPKRWKPRPVQKVSDTGTSPLTGPICYTMVEAICCDLRGRFNGKKISTTDKASTYSELAITARQQRQLADAIERHCPGFAVHLASCYPELRSRDILFCELVLIGLSEKEIFVLTQTDYSNTWRRARKIKEMMETQDVRVFLTDIYFA